MNILILGGGFGGIAAAHTLRSLLPHEHTITLVSKSSQFIVGASKTWVMLGDKTEREITRNLKALLPAGVDFHQAEVQRINPSKGEVVTSTGTLRTDFLVIALGADVNSSAVPGLAEAAYSFYTLDQAVRLQDALTGFQEGDLVLLIPRTPFKCPPAPYEAAMLLDSFFRKKNLRDRIRISIYSVEPAPMPTAGPEMGAFVRGLVEQRNIAFHPLSPTKSVDPKRKTIMFENGREASYDLLIAIPPHESPRVVREAGLVNQAGWIPVDPKTLEVRIAESAIPLYAVGDVTALPLPGRFKSDVPLMLPKAGVMASAQGIVVAHRIAGTILRKPSSDAFDGKGFCYIETGDGRAVKGEGSFFELPHPVMTNQPPDEAQFKDKLDWVKAWLEGRVGGE